VDARSTLLLRRVSLAAAAILLIITIVQSLRGVLTVYPIGVDLEIPVRAATRGAAGGQPYLASAFDVTSGGPDLPFLYPPVTLPFLVPLLHVPRELLFGAWWAFCVACGVFACRRLAIPWWAIPIALAWPPFAEALLGGNVQVPLFAAFTAIFWTGGGTSFRPVARSVAEGGSWRATGDGVLASLIGTIKVSQAHAWLFVLRHRPRAAIAGAAIVVGVCLATLPLVGIARWTDWLSQAGRSGDPAWPLVGWTLSVYLGRPIGLALTVLSLVAVLFVPPNRAGAWIGVLSVVGAPSLHMFGFVFLLPAMLLIRRDIALVGALLIASYVTILLVPGAVLVGAVFALSGRFTMLAAPASGGWLPDAPAAVRPGPAAPA
jgi:hypothetical protein